jgi:parallel beta-helix repeat protein
MTNRIFLILAVLVSFGAAVWAADTIVPVGPPSGGDDTVAIKAALEGCVAASAPCTVQFGAGVYRTKQQLVRNFRGTVKGQGMGATIIEPYLGDGPLPVQEYPQAIFWQPLDDTIKYPVLLMFIDGDLVMQDLGFRAKPSTLTTAWFNNNESIPPADYLSNFVRITGSQANAVVQRVRFEGGLGTVYTGAGNRSYNVDWAVAYAGWNWEPLKGTFKLIDCRFQTVNMSSDVIAVSESQVLISRNVSEDVRISHWVEGASKSKVEIVQNRSNGSAMYGVWGHLLIVTGFMPWMEASEFLVDQNTLNTSGEITNGLYALDLAPREQKSKITIVSNKIELLPYDFGGGGFYSWTLAVDSVYGCELRNNQLTGQSQAGLLVLNAEGCLIKSNNLNGWQPNEADLAVDAYFVRAIALAFTRNTTVVGAANKGSVLDFEGSDNIIVGYNSQKGNSAGQSIADFMKNKTKRSPGWAYKP